MKMPKYIETKQDWEDMCAFLEEQDKDKDKDRLIDYIMSNIDRPEFNKRLYAYFRTTEGETVTFDSLYEAYSNELMLEYQSKIPDTDYIVSFSHKFADMAASLPATEKQAFLHKMANFLREGVENYGVGMAEDDDWLIADFMQDVCGEEF